MVHQQRLVGRFRDGVREDRSGRGITVRSLFRDPGADGDPGLRHRPRRPHDGPHWGDHCEVRYNDVRVPRDNLLGERGQGFTIAQRRLGPGRIFHCMRWLGQAQRAFELMVERANVRYAHGSLLKDKGEIQRYVAESAAEIQAARLMTLDAARAMDRGEQRAWRSR